MNNTRARHWWAAVLLLSGAAAAQTPQSAANSAAAPEAAANSVAAAATPIIAGLMGSDMRPLSPVEPSSVGLNDELWVVLADPASPGKKLQIDPTRYALFLNGRELTGIGSATFNVPMQALVFKLVRNKDNAAFWKDMLGSPISGHLPVSVSLGERPARGQSAAAIVSGAASAGEADRKDMFQFQIMSQLRLAIAAMSILLVMGAVWGHARRNTTLRDNLLPQIEPLRQPYSLGRWQMAFWFTLIFASFVFLFILLWDANTISSQALALMGISASTAFAAIAVDVVKDSPADAVNRGLQAIGLTSYADVVRVRQEIAVRTAELQGTSTAQQKMKLSAEILDRQLILSTYEDKIRPYVTEGWFRDLTTDLNGVALHRLQVFVWTWALGIVFIINVYRELAMQEYSPTLLALMGLSCAGYVGFKFPEANN